MKIQSYSFIFPLLFSIMLYGNNQPDTLIRQELNQNWQFRQVGTAEWLPAKVPGEVHTDLLSNNKIEDPFYRLNEHDLQWIDKEDWEYQTTFVVDAQTLARQHIEMVFHGLDTYAEVSLNGQSILSADNMFRTWEADVKALLKEGENELTIVFTSPIKKGIEKYGQLDYTIPVSGNDLAEIGKVEGNKKVSVFTRKAGYHFGWDWGARLVTSGIWKPVELLAWNDVMIRDVFIRQDSLNDEVAALTANVEVEASIASKGKAVIYNENTIIAEHEITFKEGINSIQWPITIEEPKWWWPNGLGEQNLYNIKVEISTANTTATKTNRIGLRTVELVQTPDEKGKSFEFYVNGQPVFMKGANYIPQDIFLNRVSSERYEHIIQSAVDANMNMLRVWGGGIYENDIFYEMCDEKGLLVWQDFMFACAMFPGDSVFLENVRQEAIDNVKRLRQHPSIALWCGNNENLAALLRWGWLDEAIKNQGKQVGERIKKDYEALFHHVLPEVVEAYDNQRLYWASSPSVAMGIPEEFHSGDMHYWGVWWGQEPFDNYKIKIPRFMSEFGFQSFPDITTVKKYAIEKDWDIFSEVMKSHQRSSIGNGTIKNYMLRDYKEPRDFPMFLYVGQVLQAEGMKTGMEAHRRNMPYCMGSLYWQIDDCWPVASWSSIDYYGRWKAQHYFTKKAFTPILISPDIDKDDLNVFIVSDKWKPTEAVMELSLLDFKGNVIWENKDTISIEANKSKIYFNTSVKKLLPRNAKDKVVFQSKAFRW